MVAAACIDEGLLELLSEWLGADEKSCDASATAREVTGVALPSKPSTHVLPGKSLIITSILRSLCTCRRSSCTSLWPASTRSGGMTLPVAFLRSSVEMAQSATSMAGAASFSRWLTHNMRPASVTLL